MHIKSIKIHNFKSFEAVTFDFNSDLNIFTGLNSVGKTTVLEALALWHECFSLLLRSIGKANKKKLQKGEYILGEDGRNYISFEMVNSVRSPNYQDIFLNREVTKEILLAVSLLSRDGETLEIPILIRGEKNAPTYNVIVRDAGNYNYRAFNDFFAGHFPNPIAVYYASPVAAIRQVEHFVTQPRMQDMVLRHDSATVIRNRIYALLTSSSGQYQNFESAVNTILYGPQVHKLKFEADTSIQKDVRAVINFKTADHDTPKDIALLGSGALQIIEILLNLFAPNPSLLNIILLDEPDSHIHRDIQKRLLEVLATSQQQQQVFLTTHNEALIRSAKPQHLFHIEAQPTKHYTPISGQLADADGLHKNRKSFSGAYPLATDAIMRAMGSASGLDIMNALEADRIIFVEGEDDAQAIYTLLQKATTPPPTQKIVFWVLNGIANLPDMLSYKKLFQTIRNAKTLWQKSILVLDRDFIIDNHYQPNNGQHLQADIKTALGGLPVYMPSAYTFEAVLFTELPKAANLLNRWLTTKGIAPQPDLGDQLAAAYSASEANLRTLYLRDTWLKETAQRYRALRDSPIFADLRQRTIRENDIDLTVAYRAYVEASLNAQAYYKLMKKEDVAQVINAALQTSQPDIQFDISQDFIALLKLADRSTWFGEWDFITQIVKL